MLRKFIASGVQIGIQRELYRNGYSNDQKEMKPVIHRTPSINALYITTEAMTTAHVQVFIQCIFKLQAIQMSTVDSKSMRETLKYRAMSDSMVALFYHQYKVLCVKDQITIIIYYFKLLKMSLSND